MSTETSHVLSGSALLNSRDSKSERWFFGSKSAFVVAGGLVLYIVGVRMWEAFLAWKEKAYKLAMRRRHGIPDDDHRPFNVAYAAVVRAREEREASARKAKLLEAIHDQQRSQNARQRPGSRDDEKARTPAVPGRYESVETLFDGHSNRGSANQIYPAFAHQPQPNGEQSYARTSAIRIVEPEAGSSLAKSGPSRRYLRKHVTIISDDEDHRVNGDKLDVNDFSDKTGDEVQGNIELEQARRGSKRVFRDENDDTNEIEFIRARDKRQRKVSLEKISDETAEDMDVDEDEDNLEPLPSLLNRGRKRDRAEAGSSFGGDDDEDSTHEADVWDVSLPRRHRKRRTYTKRKAVDIASSRGQKRDRDLADDDGDIEAGDEAALKTSRKKRGKGLLPTDLDGASDISFDGSQASYTKGRVRRSIGDEWESNGVRFKVGPNGQRLRQALVKKARQKFSMPIDSQHPDRQANLEVYVESWLTEQEYQDAKDQHLLAWQDSNKPSAEPVTPSRESQNSPLGTGKDLLWKSTSAIPVSGSVTPRQLTPPSGLLAKQDKPPGPNKRISSVARVPSMTNYFNSGIGPSLVDSTNAAVKPRVYSKWEKQDLEARAMMKMREASRLREEASLQKLRMEKEKAEKLRKDQELTVIPKIPTITVTKVEDAKPATAPISFSSSGTEIPQSIPKPQLFNSGDKGPNSYSQPTTSITSSHPMSGVGGSFETSINSGPKPDQQQSKPPAPFAFTSLPTSASSNPPISNVAVNKPAVTPSAAPSIFTFTPAQASQSAEKKSEAPGASSGSLFSRLSPSTGGTTQLPPQSSQTPLFSFSKSVVPDQSTLSGAVQTASTQVTPATPQSTGQQSAAPTVPKFNFGLSSKPVSSTSAATSSLNGALGNHSEPTSSQPSGSSLKTSTMPTESFSANIVGVGPAMKPSSSTGAANINSPPKFSFGSSSPFSFPPKASEVSTGNSSSVPTHPQFAGFETSAPSVAGTSLKPSVGAFGMTVTSSPSSTTGMPARSTFGFGTNLSGSSSSTAAPLQSQFSGSGTTQTPGAATFSFNKISSDKPTPSNPWQSTSSGFGSTQGTSFAFQPTPASTSSQVTSNKIFGEGTSSNSSTTNSQAPQASAFSFGAAAPATPSTPSTAAGDKIAAKPLFSFAAPASTTHGIVFGGTTAQGSSASAPVIPASSGFTFGDATKNPSTTPANEASQSKPSAFNLPSNAGSTVAFNGFGKAPTSTGQQQQ